MALSCQSYALGSTGVGHIHGCLICCMIQATIGFLNTLCLYPISIKSIRIRQTHQHKALGTSINLNKSRVDEGWLVLLLSWWYYYAADDGDQIQRETVNILIVITQATYTFPTLKLITAWSPESPIHGPFLNTSGGRRQKLLETREHVQSLRWGWLTRQTSRQLCTTQSTPCVWQVSTSSKAVTANARPPLKVSFSSSAVRLSLTQYLGSQLYCVGI